MSENSSLELIYVADPMCSWCWGFSPVINTIAEYIEPRATLRFMMGGLRPLTRTAMDDAMKTSIAEHWDHVSERTGQPFDRTFFERDGFVYDTEPPCRAVCIMRKIQPSRTLAYLDGLQQAFYGDNRDITDRNILADIAADAGLESEIFLNQFDDVASAHEVAGDFSVVRQMGITGYPSVILRKDDEMSLLSAGYQSFEDLKQPLDTWLA